MKYFVLALALAVSTPSIANENCDVFSDVVYRVAVERDSGASRREMRSRVFTQVDEEVREVFLALIDHVYKDPYMAPDVEADNFFKQCMKVRGTKTEYNF